MRILRSLPVVLAIGVTAVAITVTSTRRPPREPSSIEMAPRAEAADQQIHDQGRPRATSSRRIPVNKEGTSAVASPDSVLQGSIAHDIPSRMKQGQTYEIRAYLSRGAIIPPKAITTSDGRTAFVSPILVPKYTDLILQGDNGDTTTFTITPSKVNAKQEIAVDSIRQRLGDDYVMWSWNVTPRKQGKNRELEFIVYAIRYGKQHQDTLRRRVVAEVHVPVDVSYTYVARQAASGAATHIANHPAWYGSSGLLGGWGLLTRRRGKPRKSRKKRSDGEPGLRVLVEKILARFKR